MAKLSLDDLRKLRASKKIDLRKREPDGKEIQIIVGMGTCGIAAGAKKTLETFLTEVDRQSLVDSVVVRQISCMDMCTSEPSVEVIVPNMPTVFYGKVDASAAKEIIQKHIIGREILKDRIMERPAAKTVKA
jgi:NADP-reducing hydrogenase subunit HndB